MQKSLFVLLGLTIAAIVGFLVFQNRNEQSEPALRMEETTQEDAAMMEEPSRMMREQEDAMMRQEKLMLEQEAEAEVY